MKTSRFGIAVALVGGLLCLTVARTAHSQIAISELDLVNNKLELLNLGSTNVNISAWWLCNRVNGSPLYTTLTSGSTIDTNLSTASSLDVPPGELLVLDVAAGLLPDALGELGLYGVNSFGDPAAITDYILWGAVNGQRDITAEGAGMWNDNESVDISGLSAGDTIQLTVGRPGHEAADYFIAPSTMGSPPTVVIASIMIANTAVLSFQSTAGTIYRLEFNDNLANPNGWMDARISIVGDGNVNYLFDPGAAGGISAQRFYRVVIP